MQSTKYGLKKLVNNIMSKRAQYTWECCAYLDRRYTEGAVRQKCGFTGNTFMDNECRVCRHKICEMCARNSRIQDARASQPNVPT
ncbi:hypothetical protein L207DRAFT_591446 [Hyaloscypha variabilis F]|uniref:Uncharacterized protein n=1 Tax=Hyaloscypha variabilis (strain UAMH 11265 / GT02V1 / F) TaxID=1149755 RepID=A0A2J6QYZ1_HYAVF|nr:hypothetical protein L207DRAFT_591446 [Hyaloscypha variabilis F]